MKAACSAAAHHTLVGGGREARPLSPPHITPASSLSCWSLSLACSHFFLVFLSDCISSIHRLLFLYASSLIFDLSLCLLCFAVSSFERSLFKLFLCKALGGRTAAVFLCWNCQLAQRAGRKRKESCCPFPLQAWETWRRMHSSSKASFSVRVAHTQTPSNAVQINLTSDNGGPQSHSLMQNIVIQVIDYIHTAALFHISAPTQVHKRYRAQSHDVRGLSWRRRTRGKHLYISLFPSNCFHAHSLLACKSLMRR